MGITPSQNQAARTAAVSSYEYNALMSSLQVSVSKHLLDPYYTMTWGNDYFTKSSATQRPNMRKNFTTTRNSITAAMDIWMS